jgi:hypothetical protein
MKVSLTAPNRTAIYFENALPEGLGADDERRQGLRT